jgi:hypothetical protein
MLKMDTITILSIISVVIICAYLLVSRGIKIDAGAPSYFGIIAIITMIIGIIIGYRSGSGWAYVIIVHGTHGIIISMIRLISKKNNTTIQKNQTQEFWIPRQDNV